MEAWMPSQPPLYRGRFVGAVVVHDQVHSQLGRNVGVDRAQECEELLAAVSTMKLADHAASCQIQRREQRRGSMAHVVMGAPLRNTGSKRQQRLCAIQGLDL